MSRHNLSALVRYLRQLAGSASGSSAGDAGLLERYVRCRDEAAFELLLWRHGAMVLNVCRRLLPREQDAEDAFQATFLTFVRKAGSINRRGSVAAWLYKVAYRIALATKARTREIAAHEKPSGEVLDAAAAPDSTWTELRPILDEEVNRLPERLRRPFVLCYLEGKTNEEAAQEIGCPAGTIFSRLARGREMLRQRLQRRGVTLSVTGLTAVLTAHAIEAMPAATLMTTTVRSALLFAAGQTVGGGSAQAAALAEGVLRTMFVTKIKIAAVLLLAIGVAAGSVLTYGRTAAPQAESKAEDPPPKPKVGDKKKGEPIAVKVVKPKKGGLPLMVTRQAEVVAAQQQQIVPLVSGTIKEVQVDIGDRVKKGQTLIVFDAPLIGREVEQAKAALEMAEAQIEEAEAQVVMAKAEVQSAKAALLKEKAELSAAKTKLKSAEELAEVLQKKYQTGTLPMQTFGEAKEKVVTARAKVQLAEPAIAAAEADVQVKMGKLTLAQAAWKRARASVSASRATLDKARIQEGFTELKAAFDGVVTRRTIDAGNFVQPSDSRLLRPLLTVQRIDRVRLTTRLPDNYASLIQLGLSVEVPLASGRQYTISRFSPTIAEGGGIPVEIDAPNPDNRFLPGMSFIVQVQLKKPSLDALIVPSQSVMARGGYKYVFIIRDGKAQRAEIMVSIDDGTNAEIAKGIQASDLIAVSNQEKLSEGQPVKVELVKD